MVSTKPVILGTGTISPHAGRRADITRWSLLPPAEPSKDSRALVRTALWTSATEADSDQPKPLNLKQRQQMTAGMLARLGQLTASKSTLGSWAPGGRELGQLKGLKSRNYGSDSLGRGRCQGILSSRC